MSTKDLRALLREAESTGQPVVIRFAQDVPGPGGASFVAANARLSERHLNWLEQRNPAAASRPTYVDVTISHETRSQKPPRAPRAEPADSAAARQRRAREISRGVARKADEVTRQAADVYRIVGTDAFSPKALRNRDVQQNLEELNDRIHHLHTSVHDAIDEYLVGNTLIMDLIARHDLATKTVQHGLAVAVFATEIASQVLLKGFEPSEAGVAGDADEQRLLLLRKDLAEIFLGGFMHDCGLWSPESTGESHEASGARLLWNIPEIQSFLPSLTKILLFHSDIVRIAAKPALVQIIEYPDEPAKVDFRAEFYRTPEDARTSVRFQGDLTRAEILGESDLHKVLPVALAEYCISQSEGFNARSMPEIVSRLASHAQAGLFLRYVVALCNAQVEVIAPRRAYVQLQGHLAFNQRHVDVDGCEGGSLGHADDMYSPHLVLLFGPDTGNGKQRLPFASPHEDGFWRPASEANRRTYVAAGRHRESLAMRVTGFMSEDIFNNILGEYELELRRHMQS